ncbi:MAG: hypothetical protein EAZ95_18905 [Bacteroidetes bacterium]|nr:MAG: hypothetical protein EAZ95_18905 [Bacteroidota bacterium]
MNIFESHTIFSYIYKQKTIMRFTEEFNEINNLINKFNHFLSDNCQIPLFDLETGFTTKNIVKIVHGMWGGEWSFPNNQTSGAYFLFGVKENQKGLYVGKASMSSWTSDRIYHHLNPYRKKEQYLIDGYVIEYIASIDLSNLGIPFISPALEEFLILNLKDKLNLINKMGNK